MLHHFVLLGSASACQWQKSQDQN